MSAQERQSECSSSSFGFSNGSNGTSPEQDGIRKKTSLIVNYLPQTFLDKDLHDLFSPYGQLENVRVMRDRKSGYSYGYGFVNYMREEDAATAIQTLNGLKVSESKTIKVALARPASDDIKDTNIYITNLPRDMTDDQLVNLFSQFGTIVQRNLLYDKYTKLSRGVAFIRFDRREQAAAAIESMDNYVPQPGAEPIHVKLAENHGKQKAAYVLGFQTGYNQQNHYQPRGQRYYDQNQDHHFHHSSSNSNDYYY